MGLIGAIRLQVDFRIPWLVGRWPGDGKDWPHSPMGAEKRKDDQELLLFLYISQPKTSLGNRESDPPHAGTVGLYIYLDMIEPRVR